MAVGVRVRVADWVRKRTKMFEIASMTPAQIEAAQGRHHGHNPITDLVFGRQAKGVRTRQETVTARSGELAVRIYTPAGRPARGTVVNFHGGGWVLGDLDGNDWTCSNIAARVGTRVVSVDYRLAPAHRFPAGVQDCYDALQWAARDGGPLAVMGDSAGGNLAAVMAQLCRDTDGPELAHQVLIYPATDLTMQSPSLVSNSNAPISPAPRWTPSARTTWARMKAAPRIPTRPRCWPPRSRAYRRRWCSPPSTTPSATTGDATRRRCARPASIPGLTPAAKQGLGEICTELTAAFAVTGAAREELDGRWTWPVTTVRYPAARRARGSASEALPQLLQRLGDSAAVLGGHADQLQRLRCLGRGVVERLRHL